MDNYNYKGFYILIDSSRVISFLEEQFTYLGGNPLSAVSIAAVPEDVPSWPISLATELRSTPAETFKKSILR